MSNFAKNLTRQIGTQFLPFTNPRVVCPPGKPVENGLKNIIVATPKRSGTHILIDLILNNIPAYRRKPLYIDLDQCWKQSRPGTSYIDQITAKSGYVIKTHIPISVDDTAPCDNRILDLFKAGHILTVNRDRDDIARSLTRWYKHPPKSGAPSFSDQYDQFQGFWGAYEKTTIEFSDLFDRDSMIAILKDICLETGTRPQSRFIGPPDRARKRRIYFNKTMTRLAGRNAPRIDTTIHTLKD